VPLTQTPAPGGGEGGRRLPGPPLPSPGLVRGGLPVPIRRFAHRCTQFQAVGPALRGSYELGLRNAGFGGSPLKCTWTYVPGGAGAGGSSACPHTARLPGKPRAPRNRGWRGTQRGAWRLRGCHSIPIHTYPGGTLGMTLGDPDRSGLRYSGCLFRKWGRGWCGYFHHLPSISSSPTAGERGKKEPGRRRPTGPALRPTNKRGVSGKPGWSVSSQAPEGNRREWHGRGGVAKTPGRAHSSGLYMGVRHALWGTGCEPTGTACQFAAPLSELRDLVGWGVRETRNATGGS
jgi:hypothetical protein